jgi:hypothetical protein
MLTSTLLALTVWSASLPLQAGGNDPGMRPRATQYFDPRRPGHGIDLSYLGTDSAGTDQFLAIFYSYGDGGEPEWFLAQGPLNAGRFEPIATVHGDTLSRYRYVEGAAPTAVPSSGRITLDFNNAAASAVCAGTGATSATGAAIMRWSLGADRDQDWCLVPLVPATSRAMQDFTGTWYGGGVEGGWGASILSFSTPQGDAQFGLLYYPDVNGVGRWAFWNGLRPARAVQYALFERRGYCRSCQVPIAAQTSNFNDAPAGTIALELLRASREPMTGNRIEFTAVYQIPPGGTFARRVDTFALLSQPAQ